MSYQEQFAERAALCGKICDLQDELSDMERGMQESARDALGAYCRQKQHVSTTPHKWQQFLVREVTFKKDWVRIESYNHGVSVELPSSLMDLKGDDLENEISRIIQEEGEKFAAIREQQAADSGEVEKLKRLAEELGYTVIPK
jgi:hypothetical protein